MIAKYSSVLEVEDFQEPVVPAADVCKLFREERERRGLSVRDVSGELHIRQLYLSCIEEGRFSELPGYVYVVGFIKSYANFLDLNGEELLRQLNLSHQPQVIYSNIGFATPPHEQQLPTKKVIFASLTILFVLALLAYIYNNKPIEESLILGEYLQEDNKRAEIDSLLLPADPQGGIVQNLGFPESLPEINIPAARKKEDDSVQTSDDDSQKEDGGTIKPVNSNIANSESDPKEITSPLASSEIIIVAVKDSWVQVMNSKGVSVYVRLMHAGEQYTIPQPVSKESFLLNTGNGGGIKFIVDGQETKILGEQGKIMRGIMLSSDNLKKYMAE